MNTIPYFYWDFAERTGVRAVNEFSDKLVPCFDPVAHGPTLPVLKTLDDVNVMKWVIDRNPETTKMGDVSSRDTNRT